MNQATENSEREDLRAIAVEIEGYILNEETGEIMGHALVETQFRVDSIGAAEWVLEKMAYEDAAIFALAERERALIENIQAIRRQYERRRQWLEYRFGPELAEFAKQNLPKGKKTWLCPFGSVSFRKINPKLVIDDASRALETARVECPESIKVEYKILVSQIPEEVRQAALDGKPMPGFLVEPESERVYFKTSVGE